MSWRLSDLPLEARRTAERAAAAAGSTLEAWFAETIRQSLALAGAAPAATQGDGGLVKPTPNTNGHAIVPVAARQATGAESASDPPQSPAAGEAAARAGASPPPRPRHRPAPPSDPPTVLPIAALTPPRNRLRRGGDEPRLATLEIEIAVSGLREPLLVRRGKDPGTYEIIAGERRRLAAQRLGKTEIPAVILEADDGAAMLLSLADNLGLADFTPLDEARAYLRLLTEFRLNPTLLAERLGLDRLHIAASLRLLGLPQRARQSIESGRITAEQAFGLLDAADPDAAAERLLAGVADGSAFSTVHDWHDSVPVL